MNIDDQVLIGAKKLAAESGRTLAKVMEDALRECLARRTEPQSLTPIKLTTVDGKGLQPGVDLDDSASLLDLMEPS